jgi:transcriptional regulator with XRE-family HTH domain
MALDEKRLLVKAARLYYEQHMTQAEISERLRLSRQRVQRILSQAREEGIVNIAIRPIMGIFHELEKALEKHFALAEALVVEASGPDNQNTIAREVGGGAAEYLMRLIRPNDKIVISWGNSLLGMVNALAAKPRALADSGIPTQVFTGQSWSGGRRALSVLSPSCSPRPPSRRAKRQEMRSTPIPTFLIRWILRGRPTSPSLASDRPIVIPSQYRTCGAFFHRMLCPICSREERSDPLISATLISRAVSFHPRSTKGPLA